METNHENINNHCNNRTTAHISHKHVHSTLQTTLIQMMLFVWVTPQRCGRKVDRTLCLCIYGKECRIDRTLYSTLLNSTHFFSVVDRTPTHYFWSTGWEVISKSPSHYSMGETVLFCANNSVAKVSVRRTSFFGFSSTHRWAVIGGDLVTWQQYSPLIGPGAAAPSSTSTGSPPPDTASTSRFNLYCQTLPNIFI